MRLHRINENDAGEVSGILAFLRELQRARSLAVVVVHHTRKNGPAGSPAGQGLRGSSDFHAWTDAALYLRRHRGQLLLSVEHRAAPAPDPLPPALLAGNGHPRLEILSHDPEPVDAAPLATRILAAIDPLGGTATRAVLRSSLHIRNERLGPELTRLVAPGALTRTTAGWTRVSVSASCKKTERNDPRSLPLLQTRLGRGAGSVPVPGPTPCCLCVEAVTLPAPHSVASTAPPNHLTGRAAANAARSRVCLAGCHDANAGQRCGHSAGRNTGPPAPNALPPARPAPPPPVGSAHPFWSPG